MDETCAFLKKVISWVNAQPLPRIVYAGRAMYGFANAPNPFLEICYLQEGDYEEIRLGDLTVSLPHNYVSIHSVHQGNYSSVNKPSKAWCAFIDVSKAEEFQYLYETPVFHRVPVQNSGDLVRAFQRLAIRSKRAQWILPGYPPPKNPSDWQVVDQLHTIDRLAIRAALTELLVLLFEEQREQMAGSAPECPKPIRDTVDYLELHYGDSDLTLKNIAAQAHLTPVHFTRVFHKHLGEPPMRYLRRVRIGQAMHLLRETDHPIQNIAWSVGFKDPFHFSRVFREFVGRSPREYRNSP